MPATSRGASSTIAQPVGSQTRPTILTRSAIAVREMFFTSADLQKPDKLYQVIHAIQQNLSKALRVLGSNPMLSGIAITGQSCTASTQVNIAHGLGRPYRGFIVTGAQHGSYAQFEEVVPGDNGYPPGLSKSTYLVLFPGNTGTFDFWVF
jgi:hypothetical protein